MKKTLLLATSILFGAQIFSQNLCTPTFASGCFSWNNQAISVSNLDWAFDNVDCSVSDYTNLTVNLTSGVSTPMTVINGTWCGCSVWMDLNHDNTFDNSENLYYAGNGSTEYNTFDFNITVPQGTANGSYTMRVIASWGSDGYTVGANGYGGCGDYQYGNFQDFAVALTGNNASLDENVGDLSFTVFPNPSKGKIELNTSQEASTYVLKDQMGRILKTDKFVSQKTSMDVSDLKSGIYYIQLEGSEDVLKFVKE